MKTSYPAFYLFFQKDKPYLQRTSQSLVKDRVALEDSRKYNKQKRVVALIIECAGNAMTCITLEMIVYNQEGSSLGMANLVG